MTSENKIDQLVSERAVDSTKNLNFCDGSRNKLSTVFLDKTNNKRYEFWLTRNIRNKTKSNKMVTGALRKTFYKAQIDRTELIPFWQTYEGNNWSGKFQSTIPMASKEKLEKVMNLSSRNKN